MYYRMEIYRGAEDITWLYIGYKEDMKRIYKVYNCGNIVIQWIYGGRNKSFNELNLNQIDSGK